MKFQARTNPGDSTKIFNETDHAQKVQDLLKHNTYMLLAPGPVTDDHFILSETGFEQTKPFIFVRDYQKIRYRHSDNTLNRLYFGDHITPEILTRKTFAIRFVIKELKYAKTNIYCQLFAKVMIEKNPPGYKPKDSEAYHLVDSTKNALDQYDSANLPLSEDEIEATNLDLKSLADAVSLMV